MLHREEIDFDPKTPSIGFLSLAAVVYVPFCGAVTFFAVREQLRGELSWLDWAGAIALGLLYVAVLPVLFAFFFYESKRFRFSDAGVRAFTWRGRRSVAWRDVTRARLERATDEGGAVHSLLLESDRQPPLRVPLSAYRKAATLLEAVRARLPVVIDFADGVCATDLRDEVRGATGMTRRDRRGR